jgi:phosphatidylinositol alpha-1,6-mannosyltransferase
VIPRILVVTPDFPPRPGGIQLLAHRLVSHFEHASVRVHTLDAPGAASWDDSQAGYEIKRVPAGRQHRLSILRLNATAIADASRYRPDAVLAMHVVAAPAAAMIRRALRVPAITYLYALEVVASPALARFAARHSDRIVAVSAYTAGLAAAAGAEAERVRVIPPGVDWRRPPAAQRLRRPTVVTVGRLEDRYKGHDVMVRAMPLVLARVPDAQWIVIGDGSLRESIRRLSDAQGLNRAIRMQGAVTDEVRDDLLSRAHVFAMPSRVPARSAGEGFGIVYLEAGVHGLPVVAGRAGGALDAVLDGSTGLLVDPTDHVQVAQAITRLLTDRESAARMGAAGSERARNFSWPIIAGRVEQLIVEAIQQRRAAPGSTAQRLLAI